jgi:hypothetical protein
MNSYIVTGNFANVSGGLVEITQAQAKTRMGCIQHVEGDTYRVIKPIQFKKGENFSCDSELNKAQAEQVKAAPVVKKASKKT